MPVRMYLTFSAKYDSLAVLTEYLKSRITLWKSLAFYSLNILLKNSRKY